MHFTILPQAPPQMVAFDATPTPQVTNMCAVLYERLLLSQLLIMHDVYKYAI